MKDVLDFGFDRFVVLEYRLEASMSFFWSDLKDFLTYFAFCDMIWSV